MADLKLPRIPDRTPVKLAVTMMPDLHQLLVEYARLYTDIYGQEVGVAELIPPMLSAFIESDRGFARARENLLRVPGK